MEIKDKFHAQKILMYIYGFLRALGYEGQAEDVSDVVQFLNKYDMVENANNNK